jgi:quercetin dioxygenase-like cupin family protein
MAADTYDLSSTIVHLGKGATAIPVPDLDWSPEWLAAYGERFASDGDEGRMVCILPQAETWSSWERHPAGDEVVVLLSGRVDIIQEVDGRRHLVELHAGEALVNPRGVWHTADVHEPGRGLFITPGRGTEHRRR